MQNDGWEEVKGASGLWLPDKPGEAIEGVIREKREGQYGVQVSIEAEDGTTYTTPSHKVLQNKLRDCELGDSVRIVFEKKDLPAVKGHEGTRLYKVFRRPGVQEEIVHE